MDFIVQLMPLQPYWLSHTLLADALAFHHIAGIVATYLLVPHGSDGTSSQLSAPRFITTTHKHCHL